MPPRAARRISSERGGGGETEMKSCSKDYNLTTTHKVAMENTVLELLKLRKRVGYSVTFTTWTQRHDKEIVLEFSK